MGHRVGGQVPADYPAARVLTPAGEVLYRRGRILVAEAMRLEQATASLARGWEPVIRLAVEIVFPTWLLLECLASFSAAPGRLCHWHARARSAGWLNEERWTVTAKATSIRAATLGLGYAWYDKRSIRDELASGCLKPLPLREGAERRAMTYLIFADRDAAGPGALRLAAIIRDRVAAECAGA